MARISISEVNFPPLCLSLKSSRPLPRSIAIYSVAVVAAGLAVVVAASTVSSARVGLGEPGSQEESDCDDGLHGWLQVDWNSTLRGKTYGGLACKLAAAVFQKEKRPGAINTGTPYGHIVMMSRTNAIRH